MSREGTVANRQTASGPLLSQMASPAPWHTSARVRGEAGPWSTPVKDDEVMSEGGLAGREHPTRLLAVSVLFHDGAAAKSDEKVNP